MTTKRNQFMQAVENKFGRITQITRQEVMDLVTELGVKEPQWLTCKVENRVGRGLYKLVWDSAAPTVERVVPAEFKVSKDVPESIPAILSTDRNKPVQNLLDVQVSVANNSYKNTVPTRDKSFVKFGIYKDLKTIIQSGMFYPVFISGLSGNGKSFTPEQICAELKREFYRVNITKNTNEDDLLGGFRLVGGETVWWDGPVVQAAERGAILMLDEIDYGSNEITCMQNVLEGKPFLIKKINKIVIPKPGFNIIATANTKGQGDTLGKFLFTNVLNEAFLERFSVTLEQAYPPATVEQKIVMNNLEMFGCPDADFASKLVVWANANRDTFRSGGINEIISTRRLVHIAKAFSMFKDRKKSVEICLNRFDDETKDALYSLYQKIDAEPVPESLNTQFVVTPDAAPDVSDPDGVPF